MHPDPQKHLKFLIGKLCQFTCMPILQGLVILIFAEIGEITFSYLRILGIKFVVFIESPYHQRYTCHDCLDNIFKTTHMFKEF